MAKNNPNICRKCEHPKVLHTNERGTVSSCDGKDCPCELFWGYLGF